MSDATPAAGFACPDLTSFCRLDELGLEVTGQLLEPGRAVLACRVVEPDQWCRRCGCEGLARDSVTRPLGRALMTSLIASVSHGVPAALSEVITLGRTLKKRADDVLAYFDRPGTSNGPTEALNGRLEHLRGSALGFRNLTNYIARSLLETGGFRPRLHPGL